MKKLLSLSILALCATALVTQAADEAKPKHEKKPLTAEQKALKDEITAKYDTNKDGKLDADEKAKISAEDKEKLQKAGLGHAKKPEGEHKPEDKKADAPK